MTARHKTIGRTRRPAVSEGLIEAESEGIQIRHPVL